MCSCDYSGIGSPKFHSTANNGSGFGNPPDSPRWRTYVKDDDVGRCSTMCLANPENGPLPALGSTFDSSAILMQTFAKRPEILNGVAVVRRDDDTALSFGQTFDIPYSQSGIDDMSFRSRRSMQGGNNGTMNETFRVRRGRPPQQSSQYYSSGYQQSPAPQEYLPRMTRQTAGGKCLRI